MTAYRIALALIAWAAIGLQYVIVLRTPGSPLALTINFVSYFTILCNILIAVVVTAPLVAPRSPMGLWSMRASVRTGAALFIAVVCVTYHNLLHNLWPSLEGAQWLANITLHYVVPILYLIDWLVFVRHGDLTWSAALRWLAVPVLYAIWTLIHGAATGWYPYPFADVTALGYGGVLINLVAFVAAFLGLGLALIAIDRGIGRLLRDRSKAAA